ncbi:cyclin-dependent kinase-like 1 isoform X2 [Phymastichus coffea]|uniref:cyclin-dependent kinase-like 1 isoform X2 n=1 Tax=Phymastichus coffea TaxID=108790 RepID=UPI00273C2378|nr:cyclin-dependent kinase-like 1 isoform X2 [Phymastichus coffea]
MEKYENIEVVGEGSYGIVMKCRHKETGQVVAIKKFLESVDNVHVRKLAFREIRMLKRLRHENLVSLIEVFRRKKRFYLVFEYLDHTILDELEALGGGLGFELSRRHIFQVLRGLNFCHGNHIMHRDVKPENVLVSPNGVIKLCDFGFARMVSGANESCTDYVATRWYRAPELLVGDPRYGRAVDTWAAGCLYAEMLSGEPLFPGDSDVDQLFRITRLLGGLCARHQALVGRGARRPGAEGPAPAGGSAGGPRSLRALLPGCGAAGLDFLSQCLRMDPDARPSCAQLAQHPLFMQDGFADKFLLELREQLAKEAAGKPLLRLRRDEERRLSVLSLDEPPARPGAGPARWRMRLARDASLGADGPAPDDQRPQPQPQPQPQRQRQPQPQPQPQPQSHLSRPRELCLIGPVSVAPNATYIRRLEHRGLLPALEPGAARGRAPFALPALSSSSSSSSRQPAGKSLGSKRTKLDPLSSHVLG